MPGRFGVVTACNPNGRLAPDAVNLEADSKLNECLKSAKVRHFRVTGGSQDGSHQEPGFGIVIDDPNEAAKLAHRFQQEAFFWIEDGEVYCIEVKSAARHRLGTWSERRIDKYWSDLLKPKLKDSSRKDVETETGLKSWVKR